MEVEKRTETSSEGYVYEVTLCRIDNQGNKWWTFTEPLKMPPARVIAAEMAAEWANLNITPTDFDAFFDTMEAQFKEGDIVGVATTMRLMRERRKWACEGRSLLELAKVYYLINDEPMDSSTEHHDKLKEDVWSKDAASRGFFLRLAFVLTKGYSQFSETDIQGYLKAQEVVAMKNFLSNGNGPKSSSGSAPSRTSFTTRGRTLTSKPSSSAGKSQAK